MKKEKFNIRAIDHTLLEIDGYVIDDHKFLPEVKLIVHKDLDICGNVVSHRWVITELESGSLAELEKNELQITSLPDM